LNTSVQRYRKIFIQIRTSPKIKERREEILDNAYKSW